MSASPCVSVVMSVFNGAGCLKNTLESILSQENCDFEFIVVNDGSTDKTGKILDQYSAQDARLRVIHQKNTGLTCALVRGCAEARGDFIARQDAGDISLPGRLSKQLEYLYKNPDSVMIASSTRFLGPLGEHLFDVVKKGDDIEKGLANLDVYCIQGPPHHGGTMFRRDAYIKSGGYRPTFVVAQDIDLWLRLSELGNCAGLAEILYQAKFEFGSISSLRRHDQYQLGGLAIECAKIRRSGQSDRAAINSFSLLKTAPNRKALYQERGAFYYFIASCLRRNRPFQAFRYYSRAIEEYLKFVCQYLRAFLK